MAVKKRKEVRQQKDINNLSLESLLERLSENLSCLKSADDIYIYCDQIFEYLNGLQFSNDQSYRDSIQIARNCLIILTSAAPLPQVDLEKYMLELVKRICIKAIDPNDLPSPALSTMFELFSICGKDAMKAVALQVVVTMDHSISNENLNTVLDVFYYWLTVCRETPDFGNWVLVFIKTLEENNYYSVLLTVSIVYVDELFKALAVSATRPIVELVVFHILSSMLNSEPVLKKIAPHVPEVLKSLADDNRPWSRQVLQKTVNVLTGMTICQYETILEKDQKVEFKQKYLSVFKCLEKHMVPSEPIVELPLWQAPTPTGSSASSVSSLKNTSTNVYWRRTCTNKNGLINLGNTCYLNSILQALLATRRFSNQVMLKYFTAPYWSNLATVFAKMLYSRKQPVAPDELINVLENTPFKRGIQQDSSEFLGFLFDLLKKNEIDPDLTCKSNAPMCSTTNSPRQLWSSGSFFNEQTLLSGYRKTMLLPGNISAIGTSSAGNSSLKRPRVDDLNFCSPKKQRTLENNAVKENSVLDYCFLGTQITTIRCMNCKWASCTNENFREIALAFPEKPEGNYSVQNLLNFYTAEETLSGENKYLCPNCNQLANARKSVAFENFPRYLILVLKYFKFDPVVKRQNKLFYSTYHDPTIILRNVQGSSFNYNIYAAVVHQGNSINTGHYYTFVKESNDWYLFNDEHIEIVSKQDLDNLADTHTPYMLFYIRDDGEELKAPEKMNLPADLLKILNA